MRKQDYLVGLMAALGPNEKRYFKLFSGLQPGEKRYMRLFDALENKGKYDSAQLCAELGLEPRQLADDKLYLTQTLLHSLRNYDHESNEITILRNNKENAQTLIARRMFNFAGDIIDKTLERAWELEAFELIDALLVMRSSCRQNLGEHIENDDTVELHESTSIRLKEIIELMDLRSGARNFETRGAGKRSFDKIMAHPLMKGKADKLNSLRAKSLRYETQAHYYSAALDESSLLKLAREERQLYLKHPEIKIINPIVYLTNLSRLAGSENDFEVREQVVASVKKELQDPDIRINNQRRESILWGADLMSLWNLRYLYRFKQVLPIAEKAYARAEGRSEYDRFSVTFEYALILLHNDEPAAAADKIDELLMFKSDVRSDMQAFVRLLHVMAHLALGNFAIIPAVIKSARFWLKKRGEDNAEINLFFKHAGLIAKAPADKRDAWSALLKEIETGKLEAMTRLLQLDVWVKGMVKKGRSY